MIDPGTAMLFLQGGAGILSAGQEMKAGEIEARSLRSQAKNEKLNAIIRNNDRMDRLINAMAVNNATMAARGITMEGSALNILKTDVKKYGRDTYRDTLESKLKIKSLMSAARAAEKSGKIAAAGSLLGAGLDIAKTGL